MRDDPALRMAPALRSRTDGWLGTRELPGYRAGNVAVKLDDLPGVAPDHFYFDVLLLDAGGRVEDIHSGPCAALTRQCSLDERSRFVRVVAELLRHAPDDARGLAAIGPTLDFIRERGVAIDRLVLAAQLLDAACSESVLVASLNDLLELSLGEPEAQREMCDVVAKLARNPAFGSLGAAGPPDRAVELDSGVGRINCSGLAAQVSYVVRTVGKARARRHLREGIPFDMVPTPEMLGV